MRNTIHSPGGAWPMQGFHGQGKLSGKGFLFPGQGIVREFSGWPGKFRKDMESQGKVREFANKWLWQAVFKKIFLFSLRGERMYSLMR